MIQLSTKSTQARFDVAQTLAISELREGHGEKLVPTRKARHPILARITSHTAPKFVNGNEIHQLREHRPASVHLTSLLVPKDGEWGRLNSNRKRLFSLLNSYVPTASQISQNTQPDTTAKHPGVIHTQVVADIEVRESSIQPEVEEKRTGNRIRVLVPDHAPGARVDSLAPGVRTCQFRTASYLLPHLYLHPFPLQ